MKDASVIPMINQVEYHPRLTQEELKAYCQQRQIQLEAWSPLMQGELLDHPVLQEMAETYGKTVAQVILKWDLQEHRIIENASLFDFVLSEEDMKRINELNQNKRVGPDPDNFDF